MRNQGWNQHSDMETLNISLVPGKKQNNSDLSIEKFSEFFQHESVLNRSQAAE